MFVMHPPERKIVEDAKKPAFAYNKAAENEYNYFLNAIAKNIKKIVKQYKKGKEVEVIKQLEAYSNQLYEWAARFSYRLVFNLNADSLKKWRSHSSKMSKAMLESLSKVPIKPIMQRHIEENIALIQSMPIQAARKIEKMVLTNLQTGQYRAEQLTERIMKIGDVTESRAKTIARTEVSKISTNLIQARSEDLGAGFYIWKTSFDARVRSSHAIMRDVIIDWDNPPSPEALMGLKSYGNYHAGCIFNCRCFAMPILKIDDISWPAKIYTNRKIQYIKKADFIQMSTGQIPLAA